jgi:excisionase family DNA binding protein
VEGKLWNVTEVAEFLGLARGSIYHLVSKGSIPCTHLGSRCLRFEPRVIEAWVAEQSEKPEGFIYPRNETLNSAKEGRTSKQKAA